MFVAKHRRHIVMTHRNQGNLFRLDEVSHEFANKSMSFGTHRTCHPTDNGSCHLMKWDRALEATINQPSRRIDKEWLFAPSVRRSMTCRLATLARISFSRHGLVTSSRHPNRETHRGRMRHRETSRETTRRWQVHIDLPCSRTVDHEEPSTHLDKDLA